MNFREWTPRRPAQVVDLRPPGAFIELSRYYAGSRPTVVNEVIGQAYTLGAQMAIIEYRYLDPDYRSEHSRFYSRTFRRYPSVAHRIHFFLEPPSPELDDPDHPFDFGGLTYLGFTVLRPLPGARVGRTMLAAPPDLADYVTCQVRDTVNFFGHPLSVTAAPFMAQDAQLGVCAHMTLWSAAYFHHLAYGHPRALPVDVTDAVPAALGTGRPAPSTGLQVSQIAVGSLNLGLPALVYGCDALPGEDESIPRIVCRYLNSGMPVIVAAGGRHAFVLVGYRRDYAGTPDERLRFVAQDDERGPYQLIDDFKHDQYGAWDHLIVPLPEKVFVPGEIAEKLGEVRIRSALERRAGSDPAAAALLHDLNRPKHQASSVSFRSAVVRSNQFKTTLRQRGASSEVATLYRRLQMPRWIWVIEATQRGRRNKGQASVRAEIVIDATDHTRDMRFLAMRIPNQLWSWLPDENEAAPRTIGTERAYQPISRYVLQPPLRTAPR